MAKAANDHDLLIRLDQKVETLIIEVKALADNTSKRVDALESNKINRDSFNDHITEDFEHHREINRRVDSLDSRILPLEQLKWKLLGGAAVISAMGGIIADIVVRRVSG